MTKNRLPSFRQRATIAFGIYAFAVLLVVLAIGHSFNERVEESVWQTMLEIELEQLDNLRKLGAQAQLGARVHTYIQPVAGPVTIAIPDAIVRLRPGFHDDVKLNDKIWAVLVQDDAEGRIYQAFDITQMEAQEERFMLWGLSGLALILLLLTVLAYYLAGKLSAPLRALARDISAREPALVNAQARPGVHPPAGDLETARIAAALDDYLARIQGFLKREQEFLAAVSHELRTPISVIHGANEVLSQYPDLPGHLRLPLARINRASLDANATLTALLFLAREETASSHFDEDFRIDDCIRELVRDLSPLLKNQQQIQIMALEAVTINAPARLAGIALGNILRNAIQHSQSGTITIHLRDSVFTVSDQGPGLPDAAIAQLLSLTPLPEKTLEGYGLYLVQRIALRLGWRIRLRSDEQTGSSIAVHFRDTNVQAQ